MVGRLSRIRSSAAATASSAGARLCPTRCAFTSAPRRCLLRALIDVLAQGPFLLSETSCVLRRNTPHLREFLCCCWFSLAGQCSIPYVSFFAPLGEKRHIRTIRLLAAAGYLATPA